ncbi:MAG: hypothetical protein ACRC6A_02820 [Fusobacteriaceae bacterium]
MKSRALDFRNNNKIQDIETRFSNVVLNLKKLSEDKLIAVDELLKQLENITNK